MRKKSSLIPGRVRKEELEFREFQAADGGKRRATIGGSSIQYLEKKETASNLGKEGMRRRSLKYTRRGGVETKKGRGERGRSYLRLEDKKGGDKRGSWKRWGDSIRVRRSWLKVRGGGRQHY